MHLCKKNGIVLQVSMCLLPLLAHQFLLGKGSVLFISELSMSGTDMDKIDANSVLSVNEKEEEYEISEGCQVYLRGSLYSCFLHLQPISSTQGKACLAGCSIFGHVHGIGKWRFDAHTHPRYLRQRTNAPAPSTHTNHPEIDCQAILHAREKFSLLIEL